jgi:hypothetical protein
MRRFGRRSTVSMQPERRCSYDSKLDVVSEASPAVPSVVTSLGGP